MPSVKFGELSESGGVVNAYYALQNGRKEKSRREIIYLGLESKSFFVTGIDTGIGKTVVSAILVEALNADYWKPIQKW